MTLDADSADRERRQLALMLKRIKNYRAGEISLGNLISDLEGLVATLTNASERWLDEFMSAWGDLEIPYAVALDRMTQIPDETDPDVRDGLRTIERLAMTALTRLE